MEATVSEVVALETAYEAAHQAAVLVDRSELGMLKFSGETRLDLLNRMSTQKVMGLESGQGVATVLTNDIGRMVDRLILTVAGSAVYGLTGEHNADNVARYLMRYVFFMDDFKIEDLSAETAVLAVYGCQAREKLATLFGDQVDLPLHHWRQLELGGATVYLHRTDPIAGDGYLVTANTADKATAWQQLAAAGITPASEAAFEYLRIEAGRPRFGHEITPEYIPLEANLWDDVSFDKGCYIGQEIIARMESRGRIAKKLVRLRPAAPLAAGVELLAEAGGRVGVVTSAADGPRGPLALGYVKSAALEAPAPLATAGGVAVAVTMD
ncbi:MAG: glycine cleavage system protein T [Chloroflexi bacterium]|nr:glycine cleavage system protein T [Chloroflexota bacterium]MCI0580425.1 glycine cleavage system protein T [Chloroflexota bacterium]MCI0649953.1 glycine cleavage system protein T [Chloroflexota bacterium]MCI0731842.1 glycine cleavage system protein T [Chloroflexota bacterium]